jgi:hypothetical protein
MRVSAIYREATVKRRRPNGKVESGRDAQERSKETDRQGYPSPKKECMTARLRGFRLLGQGLYYGA